MKQALLFLIITLFISMSMMSYSKTWSEVKQDSNKAWKGTKKVVHDATA